MSGSCTHLRVRCPLALSPRLLAPLSTRDLGAHYSFKDLQGLLRLGILRAERAAVSLLHAQFTQRHLIITLARARPYIDSSRNKPSSKRVSLSWRQRAPPPD